MNAHAKRWVTALVLLPIIVGILLFAPLWGFAGLITLVVTIGIGEYNALTLGHGFSWRKVESTIGAILCPWAFLWGEPLTILGCTVLFFLVLFFFELLHLKEGGIDLNPLFKTFFGFFYVSVTLSHFIWLRKGPDGLLWIFFVLVLAFSGDTAAYYVGRFWGRRPLIPSISAGKTMEGTMALIVFSAICCYLFGLFLFPRLPAFHFLFLGLVGSALGQLGDLCESALKRMAGVKDSSHLLPGHGGLLDRLDCLIFIAPFVYYYRQAFFV